MSIAKAKIYVREIAELDNVLGADIYDIASLLFLSMRNTTIPDTQITVEDMIDLYDAKDTPEKRQMILWAKSLCKASKEEIDTILRACYVLDSEGNELEITLSMSFSAIDIQVAYADVIMQIAENEEYRSHYLLKKKA